jgi:hypothetical protein
VAGNTSSAGKPDVSGALISGSHNLVGDTTGSTGITDSAKGDLAGNSDTPLAPKLAALADNGGPTQTRALLSGSSAINAGDAATCAATDPRGYIRLLPCDIGAYEVGASMVVNQQPTLDQPASLRILEDAGQQTIDLGGIGAGSGESQLLLISAVSSNPALISNPVVSYTHPNASGSLSFTPAENANGTATIIVTVRDDGGTNSGGVDTLVRTFTVQISAMNDAPDFTATSNQTVQPEAGPQTVAGWASGFSPGPSDEATQTLLSYTVVGNSAPELFASAPAVDASGMLTYTPKPGARGTATLGVVVRDSGGTASGGVDTSTVHTFTITIGGNYTSICHFRSIHNRIGAVGMSFCNEIHIQYFEVEDMHPHHHPCRAKDTRAAHRCGNCRGRGDCARPDRDAGSARAATYAYTNHRYWSGA